MAVMVPRPVGIQMVVALGPETLGNLGFVEAVAALVLSVDMLIASCPGWTVAVTHFGRVELAVESPPPPLRTLARIRQHLERMQRTHSSKLWLLLLLLLQMQLFH